MDTFEHAGGNKNFWQDDEVKIYNYKQSIIIEQKEVALDNIVRIVKYFCRQKNIEQPLILDIGCGQGTLCAKILEKDYDSILLGVDASEQMLNIAKDLSHIYKNRFNAYLGDFNSNKFWIPEIDKKYDFIVSSLALHFLSDQRMRSFFKEIYNHLKEDGVTIIYVANFSETLEIKEMEDTFRLEFRDRSKELERKSNVNWKSPGSYMSMLKNSGFVKSDIVWSLWSFGIYVGIK